MSTQSIKLMIEDTTVEVPLRTVISKGLLNRIEKPLAILRVLGMNEKLEAAAAGNPDVFPFVRQLTGGEKSQWAVEREAALREAYPEAEADYITQTAQQQLVLYVIEHYPAIMDAIKSPRTKINYLDVAQANCAIEIVKNILDTSQLTTEQKAIIASDEFWDEQDLSEVAPAVDTFREVLQR